MLTLALTGLALALAACGGDDEEPAATEPAPAATSEETTEETTEGTTHEAAGALELKADENQLAFDKDALEAEAGEVSIHMENPSSIPHNVALKGNGVDEKGDIVGKGETSTVTAELEAGSYTFYCSVGGHEAAGMKGTLTVE